MDKYLTEKYFDEEKAIAGLAGNDTEAVLETIASRYMGANPRSDYTARPYINSGIRRNKDYRYEADLNKIYPHAPDFSYVYAWGKYQSAADSELKFVLILKGPVKIWMNNEIVFGTTAETERYDNAVLTINLPVKQGWNHLVLRFTKTKTGFGAEFGTWLGKLCYYFFRGLSGETPAADAGVTVTEGFDITAPLKEPLENVTPEVLGPLCIPAAAWTDDERKSGLLRRIFPQAKHGDLVLARTEVFIAVPGVYKFGGYQTGKCSLYAGRNLVKKIDSAGEFNFEYRLEAGITVLSLVTICPGSLQEQWDFTLKITQVQAVLTASAAPEFPPASAAALPDVSAVIVNPFFNTAQFPWIFAGPFAGIFINELALQGLDSCGLFIKDALIGRAAGPAGEKTFWRLDAPDTWVRLYNDNPLYGHWNYPLGVTLYGLIETARYFSGHTLPGTAPDAAAGNSPQANDYRRGTGAAIASYVRSHAAKSVSTLEYALFDKEQFGGATAVHHLLTSLDSLDDCGSFGSLILELAKDQDIGDFSLAADLTGDHILNKQDRRPEGCFWRKKMMHHFHNETLWADDLYMSVPFLCRYASYKKNPAVLDLAAQQFEGFKKYLYMEDKHLMAHVYDFKRGMNTGIPWGRGNGWSIFSLTELLMVLPEDHPKRNFLLEFYRDLASGFLANQDQNGMWHQVLNMPSSYIETSCTAMFICAFSRGIRFGWFTGQLPGVKSCGTAPYRAAAEHAWQALRRYSIDRDGNIYGVCRGSEFSFNPRYYAEHLLPRLNDTHGIGIVLLAGVELMKMRRRT
ncbi:MAG: glycoside hydrolase family 88 protein [Treponema sp.]|nr:glycoside hydrolase family 88 protein [Treponema sp.]